MIETVAMSVGCGALSRVAETDSTNSSLLGQPFADAPCAPRALWADRQLAGRGRRDRSWQGSVGCALTFSVAIEDRVDAGSPPPVAFSLVAGLLLHRRVAALLPETERTGLGLKWPNDLYVGSSKLAGVLIETRRHGGIERVVVGIGLNLRPDPLRPAGAACLTDCDTDLDDGGCAALIACLRDDMAGALPIFRRDGFTPWREAWLRTDVFAGKPVRLVDDGVVLVEGRNEGPDHDGALTIANRHGVNAYRVGDLSLRDAGPPPEAR